MDRQQQPQENENEFVDYYRVLGVGRDADSRQIRKAWVEKMRECHPDLHTDEGEIKKYSELSQRVNTAYEKLSDAESRKIYDAELKRRELAGKEAKKARLKQKIREEKAAKKARLKEKKLKEKAEKKRLRELKKSEKQQKKQSSGTRKKFGIGKFFYIILVLAAVFGCAYAVARIAGRETSVPEKPDISVPAEIESSGADENPEGETEAGEEIGEISDEAENDGDDVEDDDGGNDEEGDEVGNDGNDDNEKVKDDSVPAAAFPNFVIIPAGNVGGVFVPEFKIAKTEVTQAFYFEITGENPSHFKNDRGDLPVENVSFDEAAAFCEKLTVREREKGTIRGDERFMIPTAEHWRRAYIVGRGGVDSRPVAEELEANAWCKGNAGEKTHPVGGKNPDGSGVFDINGNVWEWCFYGNDRRIIGGGFGQGADGLSLNKPILFRGGRAKDIGIRLVIVGPDGIQRLKSATEGNGKWNAEAARVPETVAVSTKFRIAKTEVTQALYYEIMGENPSYFRGNWRLPVENVSYSKAKEFCRKLTLRERDAGRIGPNDRFDLPTRAQRRRAVLGKKGDESDLAASDAVMRSKIERSDKTVPVAEKKPGNLGLYDLYGNVREWCEGAHVSGTAFNDAPGTSPSGGLPGNNVGIRPILIPGGNVGTNISENGDNLKRDLLEIRSAMQEIPQKDFSIGKYEVTQYCYKLVMNKNPSQRKSDDHPVEKISRRDMEIFCKKLTELSQKNGIIDFDREYRLPTSEEWEYACRAGTKTRFHSGETDNSLKVAAWFGMNSKARSHEVGQRRANAWGIYDMHGNVWECCTDFDLLSGTAFRGGSFNERRTERCGADFYIEANNFSGESDKGFRLALARKDSVINDFCNKKHESGITEEKASDSRFYAQRERLKEIKSRMIPIPGEKFAVGKFEVTREQYAFVTGTAFSGTDGNFPVTGVSFSDAEEFCEKLTRQSRLAGVIGEAWCYRLPASVEWEYACRAKSKQQFPAGDGERGLNLSGWWKKNSGGNVRPVGEKTPNNWGIYDMHGNAAEWAFDDNAGIVCRGGSFASAASGLCNAGKVIKMPAGDGSRYIGFRIVLALENE